MPGNIGIVASAITTPLFNPVSDWSLPPLHAFSTADPYWVPPADAGSVSSWRNGGSAMKGAYIGAKGLVCPGLTTTVRTDCALIADNATLRPTGDLEVIVKATSIDWSPASAKVLVLCGANTSHPTINWYLYLNTDGTLTFARPSGATARNFTSSFIGIENGATTWIKATFDQDNGAAASEVKFYLSDDGSSWTQLGSTVTNATTSAGNSNTTGITIGHSTDTTSTNYGGTIHRVIAKDGIGGTTFLDVDFEAAIEDTTSFTESSSNAATVTINSVPRAAYLQDGLVLPGTANNYASAPDSAALSITSDMEIVVKAKMTDWTPAATSTLVSKFNLSANRSYTFYISTAGQLVFIRNQTGSASNITYTGGIPAFTNGTTYWLKMTYDQTDGSVSRCRFYYAADQSSEPGSWTEIGSGITSADVTGIYDSTATLDIGAQVGGNSLQGTIYRAIVRNGIGGATVFDADFESATDYAKTFTESSSNAATVTINNTVDAIQTTGSKQPTYDAANPSYKNAPTVYFTTDDVLGVDIADVAQPYYIVVIGNTAGGAGSERLVGIGGGTGQGIGDNGSSQFAMSAGTGVTSGGAADSNPHLYVGKFRGDPLSELILDGTVLANSTSGTSAMTTLSLGAGNSTIGTYAGYLTGDIHTALIFQGDPTLQPEWADFEAFVESTTAIDVTPAAVTLQAPTLLMQRFIRQRIPAHQRVFHRPQIHC